MYLTGKNNAGDAYTNFQSSVLSEETQAKIIEELNAHISAPRMEDALGYESHDDEMPSEDEQEFYNMEMENLKKMDNYKKIREAFQIVSCFADIRIGNGEMDSVLEVHDLHTANTVLHAIQILESFILEDLEALMENLKNK